MKDFLVSWEINIVAETPADAARQALEIQRNSSTATVFDVIADDGETTRVDLTELAEIRSAPVRAEFRH